MGQKVHPIGFRLGVTKTWSAQWYADKDYTKLLQEDLRIRKLIEEKLAAASISKVGRTSRSCALRSARSAQAR
jgi:small subunit ribosomal protein S3